MFRCWSISSNKMFGANVRPLFHFVHSEAVSTACSYPSLTLFFVRLGLRKRQPTHALHVITVCISTITPTETITAMPGSPFERTFR